jgi:predicted amino acid racemase
MYASRCHIGTTHVRWLFKYCYIKFILQAPYKVKTISQEHLTNIKDHKVLAKVMYGKCELKMYQGQLVVSKEFRSNVSKEEAMQGHSLFGLSHPWCSFVLGLDL